jgi:hypothetical protein
MKGEQRTTTRCKINQNKFYGSETSNYTKVGKKKLWRTVPQNFPQI